MTDPYSSSPEESGSALAIGDAQSLDHLLAQAKQRLADHSLSARELDELVARARGGARARQRLLYCHASTPSIGSTLIGCTLHEPRPGGMSQMDPMQKDPEYRTVHEAVQDGWRIVHFPLQAAPFDDHEIDALGYEFVLEQLETC
jgi:hypothetical protein